MQEKNDNSTPGNTDSVVTTAWLMHFYVQTWAVVINGGPSEKKLIMFYI